MKKFPKQITEEDYRFFHQNGNRICFDYFSSDGKFHFRLLDGERYDFDLEKMTVKKNHITYILISYDEHSDVSSYFQLSLKQAFDLLALHNNTILYHPAEKRKEFEFTFLQIVHALFYAAAAPVKEGK